jgi:hypothetical protein
MDDSLQSEAMSAHLLGLQNSVRVPAPTLSAVVRVLAEPLSFLGLVPAEASSDTPRWTGTVESTPARRQYFVQRLLSSHLDFIIDHITLDWLSALPSTLQTNLFDMSFVPSASGSELLNASVAMVSLQTLVGRLNSRFHENHTFLNDTVLRLLQRILKSFTLSDYYRASFTLSDLPLDHVPIAVKTDEVSSWKLFLSKLFSIPSAVLNAHGIARQHNGLDMRGLGDMDPCFQEDMFFRGQSVQLLQCLEESGAATSHENSMYSHVLGLTIGKLMHMGHGRTFIGFRYNVCAIDGRSLANTPLRSRSSRRDYLLK